MNECAFCGDLYCYKCPGESCLCHKAARAVMTLTDIGMFNPETVLSAPDTDDSFMPTTLNLGTELLAAAGF